MAAAFAASLISHPLGPKVFECAKDPLMSMLLSDLVND